MYHIKTPSKKETYKILPEPLKRYWQLIGTNIGLVAESDSFFMLQSYCKDNGLMLFKT